MDVITSRIKISWADAIIVVVITRGEIMHERLLLWPTMLMVVVIETTKSVCFIITYMCVSVCEIEYVFHVFTHPFNLLKYKNHSYLSLLLLLNNSSFLCVSKNK